MNILLTNDDGYDSLGIKTLKELLQKYGHVVIVAPDSPRSGCSAALTLHVPLQLVEVEKDVYKCSGTPVDCVSMGLCCFNVDFDLVVSGCNDGWNISYDTMYSGTVGAAQEALIFRVPSIAVSAPHGDDFSLLKKHFHEVFDYILDKKLLSNEYLLNINFPKHEVTSFKFGKLYYRKDQNYFTNNSDDFYAYRHLQTDFSDDKESDCYQVENGIISIVPLARSYYNDQLLKEIEKKIK